MLHCVLPLTGWQWGHCWLSTKAPPQDSCLWQIQICLSVCCSCWIKMVWKSSVRWSLVIFSIFAACSGWFVCLGFFVCLFVAFVLGRWGGGGWGLLFLFNEQDSFCSVNLGSSLCCSLACIYKVYQWFILYVCLSCFFFHCTVLNEVIHAPLSCTGMFQVPAAWSQSRGLHHDRFATRYRIVLQVWLYRTQVFSLQS